MLFVNFLAHILAEFGLLLIPFGNKLYLDLIFCVCIYCAYGLFLCLIFVCEFAKNAQGQRGNRAQNP